MEDQGFRLPDDYVRCVGGSMDGRYVKRDRPALYAQPIDAGPVRVETYELRHCAGCNERVYRYTDDGAGP